MPAAGRPELPAETRQDSHIDLRFRMTAATRDQLKELARRKGLSVNQLIRMWTAERLAKEARK
jgi:hypothetical protein